MAGWAHAQTAPAKPDIFQATAAGDVPRAIELLAADPNLVRSRSADGRTPLHYATAAGKPDMTTALVSRGAELSAGPESPLLAAVDYPDQAVATEISQFLLGNASDPNARRRDGTTALELATARGYRDVITMLIHRGAVASDAQAKGIERVHYDRRYLHDRNGKPMTRDDANGLPWTTINPFVSVAHANFEKVKQLLRDEPRLLNTRASWGELAIEASAHTGQLEMADWLANQGAPVSTCTAVLLGEEELVKTALAEDPASERERGAHDISILAYAAYAKERAGIAERLLKAGASPQARALGTTALHLAASKGYADLAAVLLESGADVNATARMKGEWVTPLALAIRAKQNRMQQLLRERGAKAE